MSERPVWLASAIGRAKEKSRPQWLKDRISLGRETVRSTPTFDPAVGPTVEQIAKSIVDREGGFVNDPDDPGGVTNFGVTIGTMLTLGIDLNKDGKINEADVRLMTAEKAQSIFIKEFFNKPGINELPKELQATVFDMQVNAGSNSIRILQRVLNRFGGDLVVDGVLGPLTIGSVVTIYSEMGSELINEYGVSRRDYYYSLADGREQFRKFARTVAGGKGGWIKRAEEFIPQDLHLTNDQHTQRISNWG